MENENRTDWTLPRKNLNPKTKQPYKRGRNWWIVVYPESLPENWKEIISTEPVAISPLHDKDVNADGTKEKAALSYSFFLITRAINHLNKWTKWQEF